MIPIKQACYFSFDHIDCRAFGLRLLTFDPMAGATEQSSTTFDVLEDRSLRKRTPFHYGIDQTDPLSFEMTFGSIEPIRRDKVAEITAWLTGHQQYKWLEIHRDDLEHVRYKVIIPRLELTVLNGDVYGFRASVQCDGYLAYGYPKTFTATVNGTKDVRIINPSSYNGFIKPYTEVLLKSGSTSFSVVNKSDSNREFCIKLPRALGIDVTFKIDNESFVVECSAAQITNVYECIKEFKEFRFVRGINDLELRGNGNRKQVCEFLYQVGY